MGEMFTLISQSFATNGFAPTVISTVLALGVMYALDKQTKVSKTSSDYLAQVIKDNRDMSERQLATLNTLVGKITTMVDFTQALVGHVLDKKDCD
jgi:hypothetical protein